MIALLQRVSEARVDVNGQAVGNIGKGLLVLLGVERHDDQNLARKLVDRLLNYRVFADQHDKMNLSVTDIQGELLLVPQFTLAADTRRGLRPSFSSAAEPQTGKALFEFAVDYTRSQYSAIQTGEFGADMQVSLTNDGPVTFWLQV